MTRLQERMVTIPLPGSEESLEGIFLASPEAVRGAVVAPPHPLYGGSMDSPVVNELAWAAQKAGLPSLRFNWRGVGASGGQPSGEASIAYEDYGAALAHMEATLEGPVVACGYSFGAAAAVRACQGRRVDRLVLVAPPPGLIPPASITGLGKRVLVLTGARDELAPVADLEEGFAEASQVELQVLAGADHFFAAGLAELGQRAAAWLGARA